MKLLLKKCWWAILGRCMACGGKLDVRPVGFIDWYSVCTVCGRYDRD